MDNQNKSVWPLAKTAPAQPQNTAVGLVQNAVVVGSLTPDKSKHLGWGSSNDDNTSIIVSGLDIPWHQRRRQEVKMVIACAIGIGAMYIYVLLGGPT